MVVRFPSEPSSGDTSPDGGIDAGGIDAGGPAREAAERLAPVTPLRRPATSARSRAVDEHPARRGAARPVVGLGTGWNNTWGDEPPVASAPVTGNGETDATDEETERQTRKTTGVAIRQLARRGMSRWELEQLLTKREIAPEVYGPELDRLAALGVIDDASLAATLAFTQHSRKGLGRTAIEQDLKRRHIDPELIEAALADIGADDEVARAIELAEKRIGQLSSYDDETVRRRLHAFLSRKGYASDVVRQAMDAAFAGRRPRGSSGVRFQ
jgi:SOS response regulatory protein OraA/RecX